MTQVTGVTVKYIGRETPFIERNYQSGISFDPGQSRTVPEELAAKLLRHVDCFETSTGKPAKLPQVDSTTAQLETAALEKKEADTLENTRQDLVDRVNVMDKDSLAAWTKNTLGQIVPKTLSVESMRARVVGFIDQYGVP